METAAGHAVVPTISNPSLLDTLLRLFSERKITRDNAFEIDLVAVAEHARANSGFAQAGTQVEAMQYTYGKKVDATMILLERLLGKCLSLSRHSGPGDNGEEEEQKQRRRRKQPAEQDDDTDKRLCTNEELSMPIDARTYVLDNFISEDSKERDGKIRESYMYRCPMYCGLVVGDAQPHKLFEEYVERPADPSLDLSGLLPALRDTVASLENLGDTPFPQLQKWMPTVEDPVAEAFSQAIRDTPVSVRLGPVPGIPNATATSPPAAAGSDDLSDLQAPGPHSPSAAFLQTQIDTQCAAPEPSFGEGCEALQTAPDSQPAIDYGVWEDGFDGGCDGGDDWGDVSLDCGDDGTQAGAGEMSQVMQWIMQPHRDDVPRVNLSWADASAWRFGQAPRDLSASKKPTKTAPAARKKKAVTTSRCTGPFDEEHFPPHKAGKTYQLSAKKHEELRQHAERMERDALRSQSRPRPAQCRSMRPRMNFEQQHNCITEMLADLHRPRESKRNQQAALEAGDLDAAALWADDDGGAFPSDTFEATGGYCDYDGAGDDYDDQPARWSDDPEISAADGGNVATGTSSFAGMGAGEGCGERARGQWSMLSPLAQNLAPAVARGGAPELQYARRRRPVNAGELKASLWDSFMAHRTKQTLSLPASPAPASSQPEEVDWQAMLDDIQDGSWGRVEDSSVHMCYFLTLVLANERELWLRDAGGLEGGQKILLRQAQ